MTDEKPTDMEELMRALNAANAAFEAYFEKHGLEGARFGFEFHGYVYDDSFSHKIEHASIDNHGNHTKDEGD